MAFGAGAAFGAGFGALPFAAGDLTACALAGAGCGGFWVRAFAEATTRLAAGFATARPRAAAFGAGDFLACLRTVLLKLGASRRGTKKSGNIPQERWALLG